MPPAPRRPRSSPSSRPDGRGRDDAAGRGRRTARRLDRRASPPRSPRRATRRPRSPTSSRHARVSKRTFYEHFADKEACFLALYSETSDELLELIAEAAAGAGGPGRSGSAPPRARTSSALAAEPELIRAALLEIQAAGPRARELRREVQRRYAEQLRALSVAAAAEEPGIRALTPALATAVVGGLNELMLEAVEDGREAERMGELAGAGHRADPRRAARAARPHGVRGCGHHRERSPRRRRRSGAPHCARGDRAAAPFGEQRARLTAWRAASDASSGWTTAGDDDRRGARSRPAATRRRATTGGRASASARDGLRAGSADARHAASDDEPFDGRCTEGGPDLLDPRRGARDARRCLNVVLVRSTDRTAMRLGTASGPLDARAGMFATPSGHGAARSTTPASRRAPSRAERSARRRRRLLGADEDAPCRRAGCTRRSTAIRAARRARPRAGPAAERRRLPRGWKRGSY